MSEWIALWSIRVVVVLYTIRIFADSFGIHSRHSDFIAVLTRIIWSAAFCLYLTHVIFAFDHFHQWSHQAAVTHTAETTAAVTGIHWGGGLYVNYAFTLFWLGDLIFWWTRPTASLRKYTAYYWTTQMSYAFIFVNATVIFGPLHWWAYLALAVIGYGVARYIIGRSSSAISRTESLSDSSSASK